MTSRTVDDLAQERVALERSRPVLTTEGAGEPNELRAPQFGPRRVQLSRYRGAIGPGVLTVGRRALAVVGSVISVRGPLLGLHLGGIAVDSRPVAVSGCVLPVGGSVVAIGSAPVGARPQIAAAGCRLVAVGGQVVVDQGPGNEVGEIGVTQLAGGEVDGEANVRAVLRSQDREGPTGGLQDPGTDGADEPRLLGDRDELAGGDGAEARVRPAHERFGGDRTPVGEALQRLVGDARLAAVDRAPQRHLDEEGAARSRGVVVVGPRVGVAAAGFGGVHRLVGAAQHLARVDVRVGDDRDADAGGDRQLLSVRKAGQRGSERRQRTLRELGGVVLVADGDHEELLAAQTRDQVAGSGAAVEASGDLSDDLVAGVVPRESLMSFSRSRSMNRAANDLGPPACRVRRSSR